MSQRQQPRCPSTSPRDELQAFPSSAGTIHRVQKLPLLSCKTQETFQRQRAGASVGEKRVAVTACDFQCPSQELAATAALDAPGRRRSDQEGDDEEQTCSSWLLSKRNGSSQASDAEGERREVFQQCSMQSHGFCFIFISLKHWSTAEHDMNCYH